MGSPAEYPATMGITEARATLERLREITGKADPYQLAPPRWIAEMHDALKAVVSRENVQRYRLDGLQGVNMGYMHRRVGTVLEEFDGLVMEPSR